MPSTKQAFDLLKDELQNKTQGEIVFPVHSIDDCYNQDTLLNISEQERKITDEAFATVSASADEETKKSLEFLQSALTPSEILKMSGVSLNFEIEEYPIEVKREAVYQDRNSVEHDGKVEQHLHNSQEQIAACVRQAFDAEYPYCKDGVYDIEPYSYHDECRHDELKSCFEEYQKNDDGYSTFSDFLYFKYREDYCSESIRSTECEILDEIRSSVENNDSLDSTYGEGFKDAVLRYIDEGELYEIFDAAGISVEADPVNFLRGDFHFAVTLSTPQEKDMGNSSLERLFDNDPDNIGWLGDDSTVERIANNALSYIAQSQGYEVSELLDKLHDIENVSERNFATAIAVTYADASSYNINENVQMLVAMSGREALDFIDRITSEPDTFGTDAVLKINAGTKLAVTDDGVLIPTEKDIVVPMRLATAIAFNDSYESKAYSETVGLLQGDDVTSSIKASSEDFMKPLAEDKVESIKSEMSEWIKASKEVDTPSLNDD